MDCGALLWAGPVGAQAFPGGLPACLARLNTCTSNLTQTQGQLSTCTSDLGTCTTSLGTCKADLGTCQTELAACQAEPNVVFPGDGVDGPALSYHNNFDGTVTDNNTLLMWEVKVAGGGGFSTCLTNLHGVDSTCTWVQATGSWIAAINVANLGGHNDWRLPNVKELQSIVDYSKTNPASSVPGSTAADNDWSSTTNAGNSSNAWNVNFNDGNVNNDDKNNSLRVRAVRGGW